MVKKLRSVTRSASKNTVKAELYIRSIKSLPPAPTVATELLKLFNDPNNNLDRIVELIRHDPSLTAKILNRCNGAYFAGAEPTTDMFELVTRLGFYEVYCIVAVLVGDSVMALGKTNRGLDVNRIWRRSVASAVVASKLAERTGESVVIAFTAGLLHDIGKLVFASVEGSKYADMVNRAETDGTSLSQAEIAAFRVDHATIGAELLTRWGLPKNIATAVQFHNDEPGLGQPYEKLVAIVQIANDLGYQIVADDFRLHHLPARHAESMTLLKLKFKDISPLIAETQEELRRFAAVSRLGDSAGI